MVDAAEIELLVPPFHEVLRRFSPDRWPADQI
jgi:hypothetical protein